MVVAFLGTAAIGIGDRFAWRLLGRSHRGEGPPKPLPVRAELTEPPNDLPR